MITVGRVRGVSIHYQMASLPLGVSTNIDINALKHLTKPLAGSNTLAFFLSGSITMVFCYYRLPRSFCFLLCLGTTGDGLMKSSVSRQLLKNIPIRISDMANNKPLYGPSVAGLKGWTTRKMARGSW